MNNLNDEKSVIFIPSRGKRNSFVALFFSFVIILSLIVSDSSDNALTSMIYLITAFAIHIYVLSPVSKKLEVNSKNIRVYYMKRLRLKIKEFVTAKAEVSVEIKTGGRGSSLTILKIDDGIDKIEIERNSSGWTINDFNEIKSTIYKLKKV